MVGRLLNRIGLCSLLVAGCSESSGPLAPCTPGAPLVNLTAGEYRSADPRPSGSFVLRTVGSPGCVAFAANQSGSDIEYLLVPQAATGTPGDESSFWLRGATVAAMAAPPLTLSGKFEERIVDRQGRDIRRSCDTAGRVCDGSKRVRRHSSPATDLDTGQRFTAKQAPHRALRYSETPRDLGQELTTP